MAYCFGIDIGGTTVKIGFFSMGNGLLEKWQIPTRKGTEPTQLLEDIHREMALCLKKRDIQMGQIKGIGMTAPGPVTEDGCLRGTVNIGWGDVFLGEIAEKIFGVAPVFVGNDARVAALGEYTYGVGKNAKSLFMITLGTGVGGGVVLNARILSGATGTAGEIGHMTINPFETLTCNCGKKGCLEQYASAEGMVRVAQSFLHQEEKPSLLRGIEHPSAKDIWDAAQKGDVLALEIAEYVANLLGIGIANACYIVDPELIVLGGGVSNAGQLLLDLVRQAYARNVFPHCRERRFALAQLQNDAGIYGAAAMVFGQRGFDTQ